MSSDEEEYEENEEENEEQNEEEEDEETEEKVVKRKFEEKLPPKAESVSSISLLLPHQSKGEPTTVYVKTLPGRKSFERSYKAALKKLRIENILLQLKEDPEGRRLFREDLEAEEDEQNDDDDEEEDDDGEPKLPPPYWLPYLLSNDTFYLDRVLSVMYGWTVKPPEVVLPDESHDLDEEAPVEKEVNSEDEAQEENDEDGPPKAEEGDGNADREPADRSGDDDDDEESTGGDIPEADETSVGAKPVVQPPVYPGFAHPNYKFYIVLDQTSGEWHMLDLHPSIWKHRYHLAMEEKRRAAEEGLAERAARKEMKTNDEEEEDEEESNEEEEEEEEEEDIDDEEDDYDYDLSTLICIDSLMLAAIQSPVALRYILMQPTAPSLQLIQDWMEKDLEVGFSYLSTIYSMIAFIQRNDGQRLPHRIPRLALDFNYFFQPAYLYSLSPPKFMNSAVEDANSFDSIVSSRSVDGQMVMQTLLSVGIAPSGPIELHHFATVEGILLGLWLMLAMPKSEFLKWSARRPASANDDQQPVDEEDEEEDEDDGEDGSVTESLLERRLKRDEKSALKSKLAEQKQLFLPAALLSKIIIELRRRVRRHRNGKAPSTFPFAMCLERVYKPEALENGKDDPLVASSFTMDTAYSLLKMGGQDLPKDLDAIMSGSVTRHQKLYQSDLALLVLSMMSPHTAAAVPLAPRPPSARSKELLIRKAVPLDSLHPPPVLFFERLLKDKMNLMRTPLHKARSGTLRLLYLMLHRFKLPDFAHLLTVQSPLYQLFGVNERCPLPELVASWLMERRSEKMMNLEIFVNMFWHELYCRMEYGLYAPKVIEFLKKYCPTIIRMVNERETQFSGVIDILGGLLHRHSAVHHTALKKKLLSGADESQSGAASDNSFDVKVDISLLNPSPYDAEYIREESRVVAAFESLSMPSRTYYTPETLYRLLFTVANVDLVAVRYLMVVRGITTIRQNPFSDKEVEALEYAITTQNQLITKLIVGLGFTIDGTLDEGKMTVDFYAENRFDVKDVLHLKEVWAGNCKTIASDPNRQYGILRGEVPKQ